MSELPNVAVIGAGAWGKNLVRNFHQLGSLTAICDNREARLKQLGETYPETRMSLSLEDILEDESIPCVAIASPAEKHADHVTAALNAGKDVLVEKPLALTVEDGEKLVALAEEKSRILMVGHILRYHTAVIKLQELVKNGDLGRIQYLYSNRLNMGKIRTEENILWSFAPHDISVILALLGEEPNQIMCHGGEYLNSQIADVTMSQFVFPSGVRAHIFVSWLHPFKEQKLVVVGSEKMAVLDDTIDDKLVVYPHKVAWKDRIPTAVKAEGEKIEVERAEPLRAECLHFLECVRDRKTPLTDGHEALRVLRVLNACQKALENHATTTPSEKTEKPPYFVHETAIVDDGCDIGAGTKIWHYGHVMKGAKIGEKCIFGQNCNVAPDVVIGNNVKVQNNVSIYTGTIIEDDVFLGPSCVLTNVTNPRSQINRHSLYEKTLIKRGASIGANATIVCGVEIGRYAFVGAGAVVTKDLPDYALVVGNPARQVGWMSRHGLPLKEKDADGYFVCPESRYRYQLVSPNELRCIDLDEDAPVPADQAKGAIPYDQFKK